MSCSVHFLSGVSPTAIQLLATSHEYVGLPVDPRNPMSAWDKSFCLEERVALAAASVIALPLACAYHAVRGTVKLMTCHVYDAAAHYVQATIYAGCIATVYFALAP